MIRLFRYLYYPGVLYPPGMISPTPNPKNVEKKVNFHELRQKRKAASDPTEHNRRQPSPAESVKKAVSEEAVAKAVRTEPGCTASYYAKTHFNQIYSLEMKMILWKLKKKGEIHLDRDDEGRAIWFEKKP
ncbi:hypothetical protein XU18_0023 [Perkinsela sp. CCAP 1560/4]|nr:hypothetical protein XU18_0023 [Perkinsela sp. CCAP 1560/4]|eukprot:KNH09338.1 hypothetical protein XU18_0023 [Perkinsela sp. CCAP 1560/4]